MTDISHSAEARRCLLECDVAQMQKLWAEIAPHMPQPENDEDAMIALHYARTLSKFIPLRGRAYSHRFLVDNGWPSGLPDELKPKIERFYPRVVASVGIASMTPGGRKLPFNRAIEKVMGDAVLETYADGHQDEPDIVKARMMEKRAEFKRKA